MVHRAGTDIPVAIAPACNSLKILERTVAATSHQPGKADMDRTKGDRPPSSVIRPAEGRTGRRAIISSSFQRSEGAYTAPAFCAYSQEALDSGTVRFADSIALALAAVPSRMRPAMPCVMQASRNRL